MNEPVGKALYDRIGTAYDKTRHADPGILRRLVGHLGIRPPRGYLDIGCGTGNYTVRLAESGGTWVGLDRSERMLRSAISKNDHIGWVIGDAFALPFSDGTFSDAVMTMVIHHLPALTPAFREAIRVISDGKLVLFTATAEQTHGFWLAEYFPDAMEKSVRKTPTCDAILTGLREAGFSTVVTESYQVTDDLQDCFLYSGKHRPELYLDPAFRSGISTFSVLSHPEEVERGCQRLAEDIESGRIRRIIRDSTRDDGDYLFVIAKK